MWSLLVFFIHIVAMSIIVSDNLGILKLSCMKKTKTVKDVFERVRQNEKILL